MASSLYLNASGALLPGRPLRACCSLAPAMLYLSATGDNLVLCSVCTMALFMTVPKDVRRYLPLRGSRISPAESKTPAKDPWAGHPDTDKFWSK